MFKAVHNSFLSLIFPHACQVCVGPVENLDNGPACGECWKTTRIFNGSEMLCSKCGAFLGDEAAARPVFCHKCDDQLYDLATAAGVYEKALAATIISLKSTPKLPKRVRAIIADGLARVDLTETHHIIPIPLSKLRQIERGYNQAEMIANEVSRITGIAVDSSSLARRVHTPIHRVGMDQKARELTVRNAFEVVRPKLIAGKNILLVDDVFTSGATSSSCSKALKKSGAGSVNVFTLARAVLH